MLFTLQEEEIITSAMICYSVKIFHQNKNGMTIVGDNAFGNLLFNLTQS
ncbi:hypothetical protein ERO13_D11G290066v2 [Gossypium hirsutum]|nr:hypothetical protein ERO13_D11G290066v2 [Gossypium hirsutum]